MLVHYNAFAKLLQEMYFKNCFMTFITLGAKRLIKKNSVPPRERALHAILYIRHCLLPIY